MCNMKKCIWVRAFDAHFNISCVRETGKRANGHFKPDEDNNPTKWDFTFCPYCGKEIEIVKPDENT